MDELRAARKLVDEATVRLNETIDHARAAGLTYRAIHEGCGIHVQPRFWRRAQKGAADQSD